ncbi:MAG TPA: PAS domain-containing protein [Patescibacteria group bacterium]|nr:PAS domain-containing protein [Patescibacteria group bacterium]
MPIISEFVLYIILFVAILVLLSIIAHFLNFKITDLFKRSKRNSAQGNNEIVLITDISFSIISANDAAEQALQMFDSEILHKNIFDVLLVRDQNNTLLSTKTPEIAEAAAGKVVVMEKLRLFRKNRAVSFQEIDLQIRPITNIDGTVGQMTFIVNAVGQKNTSINNHIDVEVARIRHQALISQLKEGLQKNGLWDLKNITELVRSSEIDLLNALEIEHAKLNEDKSLIDVANTCRQIVDSEKEFATALKSSVIFSLPDFGEKDVAALIPAGATIDPNLLTAPFFTAPVNAKWFDILIRKTLDVSLMIVPNGNNSSVSFTVTRENKSALIINIMTTAYLTEEQVKLLFIPYYGDLTRSTNLRWGSGLEGHLASTISQMLSVPIVVSTQPTVSFTVKLPK